MPNPERGPYNPRHNGESGVEIEFQRDGQEVIISARCADCNFVLSLPLGGAATFAASAEQAADENNHGKTARFTVAHATLEVHK